MTAFSEDIQRAFYVTALFVLGIMTGVFLYLNISGQTLNQLIPMCIFYRLTGYYCPACGGTRAFYHLTQGHLLKSFVYHPLVPYGALIAILFITTRTIHYLSGERFPAFRLRAVYFYLSVAIIFVNWLVKNWLIFSGLWPCGGASPAGHM